MPRLSLGRNARQLPMHWARELPHAGFFPLQKERV